MKKMILILLLVPVIFFLMFIAIDQYTKYALKTATIKFTKEYCNEDITVRGVEINRINLSFRGVLNWGSNYQWVVETEPSNYGIQGNIRGGTYITLDVRRLFKRSQKKCQTKSYKTRVCSLVVETTSKEESIV